MEQPLKLPVGIIPLSFLSDSISRRISSVKKALAFQNAALLSSHAATVGDVAVAVVAAAADLYSADAVAILRIFPSSK